MFSKSSLPVCPEADISPLQHLRAIRWRKLLDKLNPKSNYKWRYGRAGSIGSSSNSRTCRIPWTVKRLKYIFIRWGIGVSCLDFNLSRSLWVFSAFFFFFLPLSVGMCCGILEGSKVEALVISCLRHCNIPMAPRRMLNAATCRVAVPKSSHHHRYVRLSRRSTQWQHGCITSQHRQKTQGYTLIDDWTSSLWTRWSSLQFILILQIPQKTPQVQKESVQKHWRNGLRICALCFLSFSPLNSLHAAEQGAEKTTSFLSAAAC